MAAVLFRLTSIPVLDNNGDPVPGALAYFYETGTLTPLAVYQDADLTIPHAHPVEANAAGVLPPIYFDSDVTVRLRITDADGVLIDEADPYADLGAQEILDKLKSIDGAGSGLDADFLRGLGTGTSGDAIPVLSGGATTWTSGATFGGGITATKATVRGSASAAGFSQNDISAHLVLRSEENEGSGVGPVIVFGGKYGEFSNNNSTFASIAGVKGASGSTTVGRLVFSVAGNGAVPTERMAIGSGVIQIPGISTTASAANAFIDNSASNSILRSTSSRQYKTDIEDVAPDYAEATLNLRPVYYRSLATADNPEYSWWGYIAEEVAEIDPRLVHWTYPEDAYETAENEDGSTERRLKEGAEKVPDGVQYERIPVLQIEALKRHIAGLEQRIADLEARDL